MNIGYSINLCSKLLRNRMNRELEKEELTAAQFAVIKDIEINSFLNKSNDELTAVAIAKRLQMDKPTISGIVNRLIRKGYVQKLPHPGDKRASILSLTDICINKLRVFEKINKDTIVQATKNINYDDLGIFNEVISRIITNLQQEED